ncbi:DUF6321 domain-containing protein [Haliscomenobacter sp.]|uniref:DUF6321 domain-containing protein n=1 Tax=Haliscomenobacter sp. TaxID=2717303 RepID=UPI003364F8E1
MEKKDACYYKVKASAKVWPSAYASGRLVQCRKKGAANYGNKSEGVTEDSLNESAYEEAWELISQPVPEIQQFVKQLGLAQDDTTAKQIALMIDATPDTQLPAASIPKLKNLANKGNDVQTLKAIQQISGRPDAVQQYAKIMQARDAGEGRQRGYNVSGLINSVESGNYEAPVLLKLATGTYVIGGRTRLYAALALGIPAKVKIISGSTFAKQGQQGVAEAQLDEKCWDGYQQQGMKNKSGRQVPNCVPVEEELTMEQQFDLIEDMVESLAQAHGVDSEQIWEDFESVDDHELFETAAWRRKEGKSAKGGLNAKGVASYRRENPGSKLQTAVTTKPSKLKPGSKAAKRRKSFCARMGGVKGPMKKPNGKPTRKALALRKWNC